MLNKLLISTLPLVPVHGAGSSIWDFFSRSLRSGDRTETAISPPPESSSAATGMTVFLRTEEEKLVRLDLPGYATVGTLREAALSLRIDLGTRQFRFRGEMLSDPSALLSNLGVPTLAVIDTSPPAVVWNREALNAVQPIFKAEIQVKAGESKIVYLQWDVFARDDLKEGVYIYGKPFVIRMLLVNLDVVIVLYSFLIRVRSLSTLRMVLLRLVMNRCLVNCQRL